MARILLIDDDVELCELLREYLQNESIELEAANDGETGMEQAFSRQYDAIVLDVMLPKINGFEVLRNIRARSEIPILMLTAHGEVVDRIVGLEMGADDYLPKPFNPRELLARIRAILRRANPKTQLTSNSEKIVAGDTELYPGARYVLKLGKPIELTGVEFDILEMLLRSAGKLVGREEIAQAVLNRRLTPFDRSIDVHISNLRKKLGSKMGNVERIKSIRGEGYVYSLPAATKDDEPLQEQ